MKRKSKGKSTKFVHMVLILLMILIKCFFDHFKVNNKYLKHSVAVTVASSHKYLMSAQNTTQNYF